LALEKVHRTQYPPFGMAGKPIWLPVSLGNIGTTWTIRAINAE